MNKREAFFRSKIQSTLQELQPIIGEAGCVEYLQQANNAASLEELMSLSDLQLQKEYAQYMYRVKQSIQQAKSRKQEGNVASNVTYEQPESTNDTLNYESSEEYVHEPEIEQDPAMLAMYFRAQLQKSEAQDMTDALLDAFNVVDDSAEVAEQEEQEEQDISDLADALLDYDDTDYSDIEAGVEYETIAASSLEEQQVDILTSITADMSESIADTEDDLIIGILSDNQDLDEEYQELSEGDIFGSDEDEDDQDLDIYEDEEYQELSEGDIFGSDDTDDEDSEQELSENDFFGLDEDEFDDDQPELDESTLFGMGDISDDEYDDWDTPDADDTVDLFTGETVQPTPSISSTPNIEDTLFWYSDEGDDYREYEDDSPDLSEDNMFGDDDEEDDYSDYDDDTELSEDTMFGEDNDEEDDSGYIGLSDDSIFGDTDDEDDFSDYDDTELSADNMFGDDDDDYDYEDDDSLGLSEDTMFGEDDEDDNFSDYDDTDDELSEDTMFGDDDEDDDIDDNAGSLLDNMFDDDDDELSESMMFNDEDDELSEENLFGYDEDDEPQPSKPAAPANTIQAGSAKPAQQKPQRQQVFTRGEHAAETQKMFDNFGSGVSKLLRAANKTGKAAKSHAAKAKDTAKKSSFFNLDNDS